MWKSSWTAAVVPFREDGRVCQTRLPKITRCPTALCGVAGFARSFTADKLTHKLPFLPADNHQNARVHARSASTCLRPTRPAATPARSRAAPWRTTRCQTWRRATRPMTWTAGSIPVSLACLLSGVLQRDVSDPSSSNSRAPGFVFRVGHSVIEVFKQEFLSRS